MWRSLKDLSLGLFLLLAASILLLMSDLSSRQKESTNTSVPVAILQYASTPLFQDVTNGIVDALAKHGFRDGEKIKIKIFNPEGDIATANLIGTRMADGSYKLAITASTIGLQAVANANRNGSVTQIFCGVSDPLATGVGVKRLDSTTDKPAHLTGIGTLQPVEEIFRIAKQIHPSLKRVGVVWNPAEANSEACTRRARAVCKELGIELLEAAIENTSGVREAALSLVARNVDAFWTGGDATVGNAIETLIAVARQGRVPVFSNIGDHTKSGALFDVGANYYQVGFRAGEIASEILSGQRTAAEIPVENFVPKVVQVNLQALQGLRETWEFSPEFLKDAVVAVDENGKVASTQKATEGPKVKYKIALVSLVASFPSEETTSGILRGLADAGLKENEHFTVSQRCAQGDMSVLPAIFAAVEQENPDVLVTLSTPTLQAAIKRVKTSIPIVFSLVSDPFVAGAGTSDTDHRPNVTGSYIQGRYDGMAELIHQYFPQWKRVGSLMAPAEDNSVHDHKRFASELQKYGIELVTVAVNQASEVSEAASGLCHQKIDAVVQVAGNLTSNGFPAIAEAARKARMPLFGFTKDSVEKGACLALARDYYDGGVEAARLVVRILKGEPPSAIPFTPPQKTVLFVKPSATHDFEIPAELVKKADITLE